MSIDERLEDWNDLRAEVAYSGLLIGNGASRAIWEGFAYESLYELARSGKQRYSLTPDDIALFEKLETQNFERVLAALATTRQVGEALCFDEPKLDQCYVNIQRSLVEAVRSKHIPWGILPGNHLALIKKELLEYSIVYSTNYDLILYWALMHQGAAGFKDFFWSGHFDLADTELWGSKSTVVLYLHGGLHLYRTLDGYAVKRQAEAGRNLLDLFGTPWDLEATPLFISEGTARQKLESIYRSDYLAFAYSQLVHHRGPLCVFGHSLGESDQHIVDAIKKARVRDVAISVLPGESDKVIEAKADAHKKLPEVSLRFYDSTSHPLGNDGLKVDDV